MKFCRGTNVAQIDLILEVIQINFLKIHMTDGINY